jgi:outer membrane immunogenic protein
LKNRLLSSVAVTAIALGFSVPALAQAPAIHNWSGFYVGLNAGAAFGRSGASTGTDCSQPFIPGYFCDNTGVGATNAAAVTASGTGTITGTGFTGGIQAGYNWQRNNLVYGLETDFGAFKLNGSRQGNGIYAEPLGQDAGDPYTIGSSFSTDWLFTLRGRLGAVVMPNLLVYATGGLALTRLTVDFNFSDQNSVSAPNSASGSSASTKTGWVLGGGLEWALSNNWSVKGEYLYVDFGKVAATGIISDGSGPGGYAQGIGTSTDLTAQIARAGVNYKF